MDSQWARLRWNKKKVRAWSLIIKFSNGSIFRLFIKSEMHKLFINRAKGARVEPEIKYIKKKNGLRFHKACTVFNVYNQASKWTQNMKWENMKHVVIIPGQNRRALNLLPFSCCSLFLLKNSLLTLSKMAPSQPAYSLCFTAFLQLFSKPNISPPYKILFPPFLFPFLKTPPKGKYMGYLDRWLKIKVKLQK